MSATSWRPRGVDSRRLADQASATVRSTRSSGWGGFGRLPHPHAQGRHGGSRARGRTRRSSRRSSRRWAALRPAADPARVRGATRDRGGAAALPGPGRGPRRALRRVADRGALAARREPRVTHHGRFFHLDDVSVAPLPPPPLDIWLGGRAPRPAAHRQARGSAAAGHRLGHPRRRPRRPGSWIERCDAADADREIEDDHDGTNIAVVPPGASEAESTVAFARGQTHAGGRTWTLRLIVPQRMGGPQRSAGPAGSSRGPSSWCARPFRSRRGPGSGTSSSAELRGLEAPAER